MVCMTGFDTVNGNYVVLWHGQSGQMTYYTHCKHSPNALPPHPHFPTGSQAPKAPSPARAYSGAIDISAYRDWETEDVQIVPDAVCFTLDDPEKETLH